MPPADDLDKKRRARRIPSVNSLLDSPAAANLLTRYPRQQVVDAVRTSAARCRTSLVEQASYSQPESIETLIQQAEDRLLSQDRSRLQRVINATGIVLHTNLGRAPLAAEAAQAAQHAALHYTNLEFDPATGKRGRRADGAEQAVCRIAGVEAAAIVNNNAAAVLLALTAITGEPGGEVIISRGELVEIGGSFRIPDVMRMSGAKLVEVGTTNRTHLKDYENAITPITRAILRVHASNYRIVGFTKSVPMRDLAKLANRNNLVLVEDLGSGSLIDLSEHGLPKEPTMQESIEAGAHIVTFSADKLLGGPQAGLIVGRRDLVELMAQHPLYRALRADKMCLAALGATLRLYETGNARESIPALRMLTQTDEVLLNRATELARLLNQLPDVTAAIETGESYAGGGSLPEMALPTRLISVKVNGLKEHELSEKLRHSTPPIIGVVNNSHFHLDTRTITDEELPMIASAVASCTKPNLPQQVISTNAERSSDSHTCGG